MRCKKKLTDLTGTSWILPNYDSGVDDELIASLNFTTDSTTYSGPYNELSLAKDIEFGNDKVSYGSVVVFEAPPAIWVDENAKNIHITGGSDATDAEVIEWFEEHATRIED